MLIGPGTLVLAVLLPAAIAQDTGSVEGRVSNSTFHTGIGGVNIKAGSQRATTGPSGTFHFTGLPLGDCTVSFDAPGFLKDDRKLRLDSDIAAARLEIELVPYSSLSGRVLDDEGKPVAAVRVEFTQAIRGTGTTWHVWSTVTDSEGRYREDGMSPGTYLVMARPNPELAGGLAGHPSRERPLPPPKSGEGERRAWVRTYHPSASDRGQAGRLVLRGGTQLAADIHLLAVPVHTVRGMVYDDGGKPANATLSLRHSDPLEMPEGQAQARDGVFEFADVPAGDWRVIAETDRAGVKLRGAASVLVSRHDVENLSLRLAAPFALRAFVEPRGLSESPSVELYPADAPPALASYAKSAPDGTLQFAAIYPGRYSINVYAKIPDHYLDSGLLAEQDVLGKEVLFAEGMPPFHVVFKPNSAGLRGVVENCGGATILLLPQDEGLWNFRFIRRAGCDKSGHFEIAGLRPGDYYALALDRVDSTGLDDLSTLRRLASIASKIQVDSGRAGYVELKLASWPE